ncbi:MAG: hypothetical protein EP330_01215 [Deltaproteobacteria bacterium]|nr:MAG: hypothetical protein EP330_01215 [Deltaproteobacteria bacterium]
MDGFAALTPSVQAATHPTLDAEVATKTQEAETEFQEAVPDFTVEMTGSGEEGGQGTEIAEVDASSAAGQDAAPAPPAPEMEETQQLGSFSAGFSSLSGFSHGEGADTSANARAIGSSISSMPTSDGSVNTSAGPRPSIPLEGSSDPARVSETSTTGAAEAAEGLAQAHAAIQASPGAEQVQPHVMQETRSVEGLAQIGVEGGGEIPDMAAYVELGLDPAVQAAFDEMNAAELDASVAEMQAQVDAGVAERDLGRDAAIAEAEASQDQAINEAHQAQTQVVAEQRAKIQAERQSTMAAQAAEVARVHGDIETERSKKMGDIDGRLAAERAEIDRRFAGAETDAQAEVARGEAEAEKKKRDAEKESENQSWWDRATDWVADALSSLADAIGSIFDAVRDAVSSIIDAVKTWAEEAIAAAVQWINEAIAVFGELVKGLIQGLLGDIFPGLADALCQFVDAAVTYAQEAVKALGDALLEALTALLDVLQAGLNAILNVFQAALNAALALATALITGDWEQFLLMAIEAALQLAGISPDEFYAYVGKAEDAIQAILDDPGGFIGNIIDAISQGFGQFADNFMTHLQTGFLEWLTGTAGEAGITMPAELNLAGLFDITLQVMGLTPDRIREKAVEHIGEENVAMIEHVWGFIEAAISGGLAGLWEHVQGYMSGLWDMVVGAIQDWLMTRIVMAAVTKLATMFNPVGALVQAIITVWNVISFLREQMSRIMGVVTAVIDTMSDIVMGNISGAADMVEGALANLVPVAISLLANLLGLGGIGEKVREVIEGVQETVWNAIDSVIERFKGMFTGGGSADSSAEQDSDQAETGEGDSQYDGQIGEEKTFQAEDEGHRLWVVDNGGGSTTVMVASTPMSIDDRIANWETRRTEPVSDVHGQGGAQDQDAASRQLATARTQGEAVKTAAREAATAADDAARAAADTRTEQAEATLAPTLQQLFNNFKDVNFAAILEPKLTGPDKSVLPGYLEADGLTAQQATDLSVAELQTRGRTAWRTAKGGHEPFVRDVASAIGDTIAQRKISEIDAEFQSGATAKRAEFFQKASDNFVASTSTSTDALYNNAFTSAARGMESLGEEVRLSEPTMHRVESAESLYKYNFPVNSKKGLAASLGVAQADIDATDFNNVTDGGYGQAAFAEWCRQVQAGPNTTLVPGNLRSNVWWTPDERASVENLTERGPNEQFFELCRINALAPEWYPSGFISFHIPTNTTSFKRPTVWDGMMSPLWVQHGQDSVAATGGGAPEVINQTAIPTSAGTMDPHIVSEDVQAALRRAAAANNTNAYTEDPTQVHTGPTQADQQVGAEQALVAGDTQDARADALTPEAQDARVRGLVNARIQGAHAAARPVLDGLIPQKRDQLASLTDATRIMAVLEADPAIQDMKNRPLSAPGYGPSVVSTQVVPAVQSALSALGKTEANLPGNTKTAQAYVDARKGQFSRSGGPYEAARRELGLQVMNSEKVADANSALYQVFHSRLGEGHDDYAIKEGTLQYSPSKEGDSSHPPDPGIPYTVTYETVNGQQFTVQVAASGVPTNVQSHNLDFRVDGPFGRANTTQDGGSRRVGENQHNAHIIADQFRGSGFRESSNIITTSGTYNGDVSRTGQSMMWAEKQIADWIGAQATLNGVDARFGMSVDVRWQPLDQVDAAFMRAMKRDTKLQQRQGRGDGVVPSEVEIETGISDYMARHPNTKLQRVAGMTYNVAIECGDSSHLMTPLSIGPDLWLAWKR